MRWSWAKIRVAPERLQKVRAEVEDLATPRRSFYLMVALSAIIASYGLLANSTAVVIGAMLVAPLMGPIFGVALGVTSGDKRLLRRAALSEATGVILTVAVSAAIGLMPLRATFGSEILARTEPTLYDIIIALASGLAGAYAIVSKRVSPALPGVAVATALVPPLATCGLCLATARWTWALGAFLLFVANFLAIELATAALFAAAGLTERSPHVRSLVSFLRRFSVSLLALVLITAYMTHTLATLIADRHLTSEVERVLNDQVSASLGARLSEVRVNRSPGTQQVVATILTPRAFEPDRVAALEKDLQAKVSPDLNLVVRSLLSQDMDDKGPVFIPDEERERQEATKEEAELLAQVSQVLTQYLSKINGAQVTEVRRQPGSATDLSAVVQTPVTITPAQVAEAQKELQDLLELRVRLTITSVFARSADAQRFLGAPEQPALTGDALRLHQRLQEAVQNQTVLQVPGAQLLDLRESRENGRLVVNAALRTPAAFGPAQVQAIQAALRQYVQPNIDLTITSTLGAQASATAYLPTPVSE